MATTTTTTTFRYLSPKSLATMHRIDHTIIPVYTDPPIPPASLADLPSPSIFAGKLKANNTIVSRSNQRTKNQFRPRLGKGGTPSYQLRQYAEVTLGNGSLRKVVKLPEGEDENEWLAVNSELPLEWLEVGCFRPNLLLQWSTFTTKLICSTAPSPNSVPPSHALR